MLRVLLISAVMAWACVPGVNAQPAPDNCSCSRIANTFDQQNSLGTVTTTAVCTDDDSNCYVSGTITWLYTPQNGTFTGTRGDNNENSGFIPPDTAITSPAWYSENYTISGSYACQVGGNHFDVAIQLQGIDLLNQNNWITLTASQEYTCESLN